MKSLVTVGMMFLSMGLFAQQSSRAEVSVKEKDRVCVKKCDRAKKDIKMKLAPMQQVDTRKSILRPMKVDRKHEDVNLKKADVQNRRIVPLVKKSAKVNESM
jgi:hypothetical protein